MYLTDLHTHSILSMDGRYPLSQMAQSACRAGLAELCVTDHCDLLNGDGQRRLDYDWEPVFAQYDECRAQFCGRLELRLGIELGEPYVSPEHARAILAGGGERLDFVIGSIHNYSERRGGGDFYYDKFNSPEKCHAALDDYFDSMEALVGLEDCYDSLGHIIYPLRYMVSRDGQNVTLERYWDRLAEILRRVIRTGRGIEINTCRGRTVRQWEEILRLYKDLGGEYLTVGSDAHHHKDVGRGVSEAMQLIEACGFSRITVYRGRRPSQIKI